MVAYKKVLCPVDFSDHSQAALEVAAAMAARHRAALSVLHVFPSVPSVAYGQRIIPSRPATLTEDDRASLNEYAREFIHRDTSGLPGVEVAIVEGEPAAEILKYGAETGADLMVLGTHGRHGFDRLVLGSVAERVLRRASCPTLTVPRRQAGPESRPAGTFSRILCPVDFSTSSVDALDYAQSLANDADATLTALHVITNVLDDWSAVPEDDDINERLNVAELFAKREDQARRRIQDLADARAGARAPLDTAIVRGSAGPTIVKYAAAHHHDLIVMGIDSRSVADLMFCGSTTQHVVRHAAGPVLTLRHRAA
jgi:nucleotide-binding universal stress UspA family protein